MRFTSSLHSKQKGPTNSEKLMGLELRRGGGGRRGGSINIKHLILPIKNW